MEAKDMTVIAIKRTTAFQAAVIGLLAIVVVVQWATLAELKSAIVSPKDLETSDHAKLQRLYASIPLVSIDGRVDVTGSVDVDNTVDVEVQNTVDVDGTVDIR